MDFHIEGPEAEDELNKIVMLHKKFSNKLLPYMIERFHTNTGRANADTSAKCDDHTAERFAFRLRSRSSFEKSDDAFPDPALPLAPAVTISVDWRGSSEDHIMLRV